MKKLLLISLGLTLAISTFCCIDIYSNNKCVNGLCNEQANCVCFEGFIHLNNTQITDINEESFKCNYKMKMRWVALALEFFFPFGLGYFYLEIILWGYFKFLLFASNFIINFIYFNLYESNFLKKAENIAMICYMMVFFLDILYIQMYIQSDGNGISLSQF